MKTTNKILIAFCGVLLSSAAQAVPISGINTSASGTGDGTFTTDYPYGYTFDIVQDTGDYSLFHATLTNTSSSDLNPEALIDGFVFNMDSALLGTDFSITNIVPAGWTISAATGGVLFDYEGDAGSPGDRLGTGEALTFDFDFYSTVSEGDYSFWLNADTTNGNGFGGGTDSGQVAVSFQSLGDNGGDSDLLASNWDGGTTTQELPEPAPLALLGLGLIGVLLARRRAA